MSRTAKGCTIAAVVVLVLIVAVAWGIWAALGHGALAYRAIGWVYSESQEYRGAAHWYGKAVRAQPKAAELRTEYARALSLSHRPDEALKEYEEASKLEPKWADPLLGIARLRTKAGDLAQAQKAIDEALKLSPTAAQAQLELGRLKAAQGKLTDAAGALKQAVASDPGLGEGYAELGQVFEKEKKTGEAIKAYESGALSGDETSRGRLLALGQTPPTPSYSSSTGTTTTTGPSGTTTTSSSGNPPAAFFGFMGVFMVAYFAFIAFMLVFALASWVVSLLAIYDCARRDFDDPSTRAMWCLLLAFFRWIGALIYYFAVYRKNDPPLQQKRLFGAPPSPMGG